MKIRIFFLNLKSLRGIIIIHTNNIPSGQYSFFYKRNHFVYSNQNRVPVEGTGCACIAQGLRIRFVVVFRIVVLKI